jgi:hypothetical protein
MLRDRVAPALRAEGMKGSGSEYSIPSPSHWVLLGFQRSRGSTASIVEFTVNCKVVRKDVWATAYAERPYIGVRPKPNSFAGSFEWWRRIGRLMPVQQDKWWSLPATGDTEAIAADVLAAISAYALPEMRRRLTETTDD